MNPAEFRVIRERLGLPAAMFGALCGVTVVIVYRYSRPSRTLDVPENVATAATALETRYLRALERLTLQARREGEMRRLRSDAEFDAEFPELAGWGSTTYGRLLGEAAFAAGVPVVYA